MKASAMIRRLALLLAATAFASLTSCETTSGNTQTIRHHPHQHDVSR